MHGNKVIVQCGEFASHASQRSSFRHMSIPCCSDVLGRKRPQMANIEDTKIENNMGDVDHLIEMLHPGHGMCCFKHWVFVKLKLPIDSVLNFNEYQTEGMTAAVSQIGQTRSSSLCRIWSWMQIEANQLQLTGCPSRWNTEIYRKGRTSKRLGESSSCVNAVPDFF